MLRENVFCSKRAKMLVALCENEPSPTSSEVSAISSCFSMTPVPSWWDSIFEASDLVAANHDLPTGKRVNSAKRKLSFSPTKDVEVSPLSLDIYGGVSRDNCIQAKSHDQDIDVYKKEVCALQLYLSQKKIVTAKLALNAGEHITTKGKLKKGRSLKPSCKETCKRCGKPQLTLSERQEINSEFWALKDHVKQWTFINRSVTSTKPKRKTCTPGAKGGKLSSRVYHFNVSDTLKIVCKTMFKSTLSICDSWIGSALSHFSNGEMTCDKRERNKSRHSLSP